MSPPRQTWRATVLALAAALLPGLALSAGPALAAERESVSTAEIRSALQRDLHLTAKEVKEQGALQTRAIKLDGELQATLGSAYAGSVYDAKSGKLVAMVSDSKQLAKARALGAKVKLVKHSKAELERIKTALDAAAGTARTVRQASPQRHRPNRGLIAWYVDAASNTVHVTVKKDQATTAKASLEKYGDAVTIEQTELEPTATADYMQGGDEIRTNGRCSAGFNLRNPATGQGFLLTAGHCVTPGTTVRGQNDVVFGTVLESRFGLADDALVRNDNPGFWLQGPWVDTNPSNGSAVHVAGWTDPPQFTSMCKSGITTKWTCGTILAKNESVFVSGVLVRGLTRNSACAEQGDSGGANLSMGASILAAGVTSAAQLLPDAGGRLRCLSAFGQQSLSWYYPILLSLPNYARFGVTVW